MSIIEQNQNIITEYREAGQPWPATTSDIAVWAINNKRWRIHPAKMIRLCAEQMGDAMRQEYITDPQGRRVRGKHAAPYHEQGKLALKWDDMRSATHRHMETSFAHRRNEIVGDCRQLSLDLDSYNENFNKTGKPIRACFDFTDDLAERDMEDRNAA